MPLDFNIAPHAQAAAAIRGKTVLAQDVFYGMLRELRGRAFTISGVTSANVMQKVRDRLAELPEGGNWEEIKQDIAQDMEPYLGEGAERRAELLLKVHGFQAYQAANWRELHSDDTLTHVQYMSTEDDRVRSTHAALNGIILPKADPFWLRHWPPWEWGCRCNTRGILPEMVEAAREADKGRAPDDKLVLEGATATALRNGQLIRNGQAYWVGPPEGEGAWYWSPADLRLPVSVMEQRYDPQVWAAYEFAAKGTLIDDDTSLWEWMHEQDQQAQTAEAASQQAVQAAAQAVQAKDAAQAAQAQVEAETKATEAARARRARAQAAADAATQLALKEQADRLAAAAVAAEQQAAASLATARQQSAERQAAAAQAEKEAQAAQARAEELRRKRSEAAKKAAATRAARKAQGATPTAGPSVPTAGDFPETTDALTVVRRLGGTTGAELVQDTRGRRWVRKRGASPDHVREETAADAIYRAAGVPVPESRVYETDAGPVKLARFIPGKSLREYLAGATPDERRAVTDRLRADYALDAALGNWDVLGTGQDNILVDEGGTPWRIDNGGSLRFRAQGKRKTAEEWTTKPDALWTMRDDPINRGVFDGMTVYDMVRGLRELPVEKLLAAAPAEARRTLAARLDHVVRLARAARSYETGQFKPAHAEKIVRHQIDLREEQVFARMAPALQPAKAGEVVVKDGEGRTFNHLRSTGAAAQDTAATVHATILQAVKTVNGHHAKGDKQYNATKLAAARALLPKLKQWLANGTAWQKEVAPKWIAKIIEIEAVAQDKSTAAKVSTFAPPPSTPPDANESVVARLARFINENGGNYELVRMWAGSQGISSGSSASEALKAWILERLAVPRAEFRKVPEARQITDYLTYAAHSLEGVTRGVYDRTFELYQAAVQEILANVDFPGNDRERGLARVIRVVTTQGAVKLPAGEVGVVREGVNESGSLFRRAKKFDGHVLERAVPHSRITGLYFLERTPGASDRMFLGDDENEVTFVAAGLPALHRGWQVEPAKKPGNDSTTWLKQ